jgi:hypothetical protein
LKFPREEKQPKPISTTPALVPVKNEVKMEEEEEQPVFDINNVKAEPQEPESMQVDDSDHNIQVAADHGSSVIYRDLVVKEESVVGTGSEDNNCLQPGDIKSELLDESCEEGRSNLAYKVSMFFQRNASHFQTFNDLYRIPEQERCTVLVNNNTVLAEIFQYLTTFELVACRSVCKVWCKVARSLAATSSRLDLSGMKVTAHMVQVVAARKPQRLILDWTNISKQQVPVLTAYCHFV